MKRKFTLLKLALLAITLGTVSTTKAQTAPYQLYLMEGSSITVGPTAGTADEVVWADESGNPLPSTDGNFTIEGLSVGPHTLKVHSISATNSCSSEILEYKVYILPSQFTLNTPTPYCENASDATATIQASLDLSAGALPAGVTYKFTWAAANPSGTPITTYEVLDDTKITFKGTEVGENIVTATLKYTIASSTAYGTRSGQTTMKVLAKPAQPVIEVKS